MARRLRAIAAFLEDLSSVVYIPLGPHSQAFLTINCEWGQGSEGFTTTSTNNSRFISNQWIPADREE